ncbi:MAG: hypothetical protein K9M57_07365 [Phycisphaerae bacterium]|nr:hypothetical protein [Phycisphaerae bacterium]
MKKKIVFIAVFLFMMTGLAFGEAVMFTDYFPLSVSGHGKKTFQWTYGRNGSFKSEISGTQSVPYGSGAIEGVGISNFSGVIQLYASNDGTTVKWLAMDDLYLSTDQNLTAHPAGWSFSTITDGMLLDQGDYYYVEQDLSSAEIENNQVLLFTIQDVTVYSAQYTNTVIVWYLDTDYPFTALDFSGNDSNLGITLPGSTQTSGYSVTAFDVYAEGIGMIAGGDISAETGKLTELAELSAIDTSNKLMPLAIGQTFTYDRIDGNDNGWTTQLVIDSKATFNSMEYFHVTSLNYDNDQGNENWGYVRSTESQLYGYNSKGPDYLQQQIADVGTRWSTYSPDDDDLNYVVNEIVAIEDVTTPYGEFQDAYKTRNYQCVDPDNLNLGISPDWYEWIVPGVGMVKQVDYWADNAPVTMELSEISSGIGLSVVGTKLPTSVVSGSGEKISLTALVENTSQVTFKKGAAVDIYFYVQNIDTEELYEIGRLEGKSIINLKPGKVANCTVTAYLPEGLADGDYVFEASIGDALVMVEDHIVSVQEGFVALEMAPGKVSLPSAVIAGEAAKTSISVVLTNIGNITTEKTGLVDMAVVARPVGGGDDVVLDVSTVKFGNVKSGRAAKYTLKPTIPDSVPEGIYEVAVQYTYGDAVGELVLDGQIVISEPFVDLVCSVADSSGLGMIIPGSKTKMKVLVEIGNTGNVALGKSDVVDVQVYLRNQSGDQNDILIAETLGYKVGGLKNGKPKKLNILALLPATVPGGDYYSIVVVDSSDNILESDETNNEAISNTANTVAGGFMEMAMFNSTSNENYTSTIKGNLYGDEFSGQCMINVANYDGNITETVTSNDGFDTQQMTYNWYQNEQGVCLGSWGQEIDMGAITFDFNDLVVFPADGSTNGQGSVSGSLDIDAAGTSISVDLAGTATASGVITGVKTVKVNGVKYDAVENKVSLSFIAEGQVTGEGEVIEISLLIKQYITYWTTSDGIIKSQIKSLATVKIPSYGSVRGSGIEVREIVL